MKTPKNPRIRNIAAIAAIVLLAVGAAFVFRAQHSPRMENTSAAAPQTAAAAAPAADSGLRTPDSEARTPDSGLLAPATTTPAAKPPLASASAPQPLSLSTPSPDASDDPAASLSPKERAALDKIPDAAIRDQILALTPAARARALKSIAANPPPKADYASLRITSSGMLYYVCEFPISGPGSNSADNDPQATTVTAAPGEPLAASVPANKPPVRHSRPGSRNILYLDFTGNNGENIVDTAWNGLPKSKDYVPAFRPKPYSGPGDTDPNTFSDQEQLIITQIWERVAEYYSAFDVDVTTERPATFTPTTGHAIITNSTGDNKVTMPSGDNAGGVGFRNVFGEVNYPDELSPVFVYYNNLGNNIANIAYATAHELGHNLGLSHDGPGSQPGNDTDGTDYGYYDGHSGGGAPSWAPIMGAGYGMTVIQFSKGDYYKANNHEDDLAIIAGKLGYRGELGATTRATALPLTTVYDGSIGGSGVIRNASFSHYYALALSGSVNIKLTPARSTYTTNTTVFGCTDLSLEILNSAGSTIATNSPANLTTASLGVRLTGTSYVRITSGGAGSPTSNPPTGYTAYGSIGQYTLSTDLVYTNPTLDYTLNSDLDWTNDPANPADWSGQYRTTHAAPGYLGLTAAQSGAITQGQSTSMSATVEGTGTFTYWWKNNAAPADILALATTDGNAAPVIRKTLAGSSGTAWTSGTTIITTTGTHDLIFTYDKASNNSTTSTAWVADVDWTPADWTLSLTPNTKEAPPETGAFTLEIDTPKKWTAEPYANWITLSASAGTGTTTLTVTCATNATASPRRSGVIVTSAGINRGCTIWQPVSIPFPTALNNNLVWTTGGNAPWTTQTLDTHDGQSAARTGIIHGSGTDDPSTYQKTWLQTTVTGTGILSFYWKISSEPESTDDMGTWGDFLYFYIDGLEQARISGTLDAPAGQDGWDFRSFPIDGAGTHTVQWVYVKDPAESTGADAAWLDQVTWGEALLNLSLHTKQVPVTSGQFSLGVNSSVAWTVTTDAAWLTITPASGNGDAQLIAAHEPNTATTSRTAHIILTGGGMTDTCVVTQAAVVASGTSGNNPGGGGNNGGGNSGGGGGGGGGVPSPWSLLAIGLLLGIRVAIRTTKRKA